MLPSAVLCLGVSRHPAALVYHARPPPLGLPCPHPNEEAAAKCAALLSCRALGMLEDELSALSDGLSAEEASQRLRAMLEAECSALSASPGLTRARARPAHTPERSALSSLLRSHGSGLQVSSEAQGAGRAT